MPSAMKRSAQLLTAITLLALAASSLVACSKKTPEPSPSPAETPAISPQAATTATAPAPIPRGPRPSIPLDQLQSSCNAHLGKFAGANKNASGAICTPTEVVLFQKDTTGGCLDCMFQQGCLDDTIGDSVQECEDSGGTAGITSGTEGQCLATLRCLVGAGADGELTRSPARGLTVNAYCGDQMISPGCTGTPGPKGECAAAEKAGYPASFSPGSIIQSFGRRTYASGMANAIVNCAISSKCASCID
jgi:hypothetical protein